MPAVCQALCWTVGTQQGMRQMKIPALMEAVFQQDRHPMKEHSWQGIPSKEEQGATWYMWKD